MSKSKLEFITDREGNKKKVIVPVKIWEQLLDELEGLEDIKLYDEAKKERGKPIAWEEVKKELQAKHARHAV